MPNAGVARYSADPRAAGYVRRWYAPTGRLTRPMLAVCTTYDPLVPPWTPDMYAIIADQGGASALFVQQYVKRAGHCAINPVESKKAFDQLREWVRSGTRPPAGAN